MKKIFEAYAAGEITREEANKQLEPFGLSLVQRTEEELEAKRAAEREGEFVDIGRQPEHLPDKADMSRKTALAGQKVLQKTKAGSFEVEYDEDGYAVSAKRANV